MDTVWAILWGLFFFFALLIGWLSWGGGGDSGFDTKDPGDFY